MYHFMIDRDAQTVRRFRRGPNPPELQQITDGNLIVLRVDETVPKAFILAADGTDDYTADISEVQSELGVSFDQIPQGHAYTYIDETPE